MAECEVKIVKTDLGEKLNIGHGKKKVSAGVVAWSPDGQQLAVLRVDIDNDGIEHQVTSQVPRPTLGRHSWQSGNLTTMNGD